MAAIVLALPGVFFGAVSLVDWTSRRVTGEAFTASSFIGSVVGLLGLLAGVCSPVFTGLGWVIALRSRRSSAVVETVATGLLLVLATLASMYFVFAYILPIFSSTAAR
jgi:hypothetical protein